MRNEQVKQGRDDCRHTYTRQSKANVSILVRVCTQCGQEEVVCDNEHIDAATAKKLVGR